MTMTHYEDFARRGSGGIRTPHTYIRISGGYTNYVILFMQQDINAKYFAKLFDFTVWGILIL